MSHVARIRAFMQKASQPTPATPGVPPESVRLLRARLILEEALEAVEALGFDVILCDEDSGCFPVSMKDLSFIQIQQECNLYEIIKECSDVSVVTTGTFVACGLSDIQVESALKAVDQNNLDKFGPGSFVDENGKHRKPPNHPKPDLHAALFGD